MTTEEFSNEFDVLVNSDSNIKPFGTDPMIFEFNEYEKSVFLTKAQEQIVTSLYNGTLTGDGFDKTEDLKRYLSGLSSTVNITTRSNGDNVLGYTTYFFNLPDNVMFITQERAELNTKDECSNTNLIAEVVPVTQDELNRTLKNPFKKQNKRRVLRLDSNTAKVELISDFSIRTYQVKYIRVPKPIILTDFPDDADVTIGRESAFTGKTKTECELNPVLHRIILETGVAMALKSRAMQANKSN